MCFLKHLKFPGKAGQTKFAYCALMEIRIHLLKVFEILVKELFLKLVNSLNRIKNNGDLKNLN
jgi:hypothetical protein